MIHDAAEAHVVVGAPPERVPLNDPATSSEPPPLPLPSTHEAASPGSKPLSGGRGGAYGTARPTTASGDARGAAAAQAPAWRGVGGTGQSGRRLVAAPPAPAAAAAPVAPAGGGGSGGAGAGGPVVDQRVEERQRSIADTHHHVTRMVADPREELAAAAAAAAAAPASGGGGGGGGGDVGGGGGIVAARQRALREKMETARPGGTAALAPAPAPKRDAVAAARGVQRSFGATAVGAKPAATVVATAGEEKEKEAPSGPDAPA